MTTLRRQLDIYREDLAGDRFLIGTPEECIEQIETCLLELGANHILFRVGTTTRELKEKTAKLELIGGGIVQYYRKEGITTIDNDKVTVTTQVGITLMPPIR